MKYSIITIQLICFVFFWYGFVFVSFLLLLLILIQTEWWIDDISVIIDSVVYAWNKNKIKASILSIFQNL